VPPGIMHRELRQTAMGQARQLGRAGGLGVVVAGALCAAVLFISGGVLPDPADQGGIPGVVIGSSPGGDALPVVRQDGGAELYRRVAASAPEARGKRARRRRGGPRGDARVRGGSHPRLGDGGAAGLVKSRSDAPAPPGRRPEGGGPSGPGSGSPSGGQNGALVPPAAARSPSMTSRRRPSPHRGRTPTKHRMSLQHHRRRRPTTSRATTRRRPGWLRPHPRPTWTKREQRARARRDAGQPFRWPPGLQRHPGGGAARSRYRNLRPAIASLTATSRPERGDSSSTRTPDCRRRRGQGRGPSQQCAPASTCRPLRTVKGPNLRAVSRRS
jgi:hypothetical protein